jgi:hypothetical protein
VCGFCRLIMKRGLDLCIRTIFLSLFCVLVRREEMSDAMSEGMCYTLSEGRVKGFSEGVGEVEWSSFDWKSLSGIKGTFIQNFNEGRVIVESDAVNDSLFRLLQGTVEVRKGSVTFGTLHHTDVWPIFCEMSAFAIDKADKITSMSIVAASPSCNVQVIPREALNAFLYEGPHRYEIACLFFETMCRHFTLKLMSVPTRTLRSGANAGTYHGCITIRGETVIFSTTVCFCFFTSTENQN